MSFGLAGNRSPLTKWTGKWRESESFGPNGPNSRARTRELVNGLKVERVAALAQPGSLLRIPRQDVPSRGWGEQFWVKITEREGPFAKGIIDNPLYESRLHELYEGREILFHEDHILAVHGIHNDEIIQSMDEQDLDEFEQWVQSQNR